MKKILFALAAMAAILSCSNEQHFISDKGYRHLVENDFQNRLTSYGLTDEYALPAGQELTVEEKEALEFLYAYMPIGDFADYPSEFFLENVRSSFATREEMGWNVPERLFRHFVLPLRVNNENLDSSRVVFYRELKPRVEGKSMADAILEVNHWCHEKLTYQPSDARTLSPLSSITSSLGRCGEESTFTVAALRSVGIPARQVYTPRWAHSDDNHAWVEAWADGEWHFMGACEPEPVLDLGWFNAPASRALLMHTRAFGKYDGPEEKVMEGENFTEINLIDNYAQTARVDFKVVDESGAPVDSALVDFKIYNYAEFYSALSKYTDSEGNTFLTAGKGDMLAWASKNGTFGYSKVSFGKDSLVTITISKEHSMDPEAMMIVPPAEHYNIPEVTEEQRAQNDVRVREEDRIRKEYMSTFVTSDGTEKGNLLAMSAGNHPVIAKFLEDHPDQRAIDLLNSLSHKDLIDVTKEILDDSYNATESILGPRIENEFLSPYKSFLLGSDFGMSKEEMSQPASLVKWVTDNISLIDDSKTYNIPMSPIGVYNLRWADRRSRNIFFVALARTYGIEARKDPVTGKIQYREDGQWFDVSFGESAASVAPTGTLVLEYSPTATIDNPSYYSHFTVSRIDGGRTRLMEFDEGQVDMGGGVTWKNVFKDGVFLDEGSYVICSGNRVSDGSVPVTMQLFEIKEGQTTTLDLTIREDDSHVSVKGSFDSESKYYPAAADWTLPAETASLLSQTGRGSYVVGFLGVGKEPTNHVLKDIAAVKSELEEWGRPMILLCKDQTELNMLKDEIEAGRYGNMPSTVSYGVDPDSKLLSQATAELKLKSDDKPVILIADTFNKVYFISQGYTIGVGERLKDTVLKMGK